MTCTVFGPGLVGSYLGIAAGATRCVVRPGSRPRALRALLPGGPREWRPQTVALTAVGTGEPLLVATPVPATPWRALPPRALAAQNGLGQPRPVLTCFLALDLDADGVVRHVGPPPRVALTRAPAWAPLVAAWRAAGVSVDERDDARPAQWEKAVLNATVGPLCLATGAGMGEVWGDPALRALVLEATAEGVAIARACGVALDDGAVHRAAAFFAGVGSHRPSLLRHPGELPAVLGRLLRHAGHAGVAAPALTRIAALAAQPARAVVGGG